MDKKHNCKALYVNSVIYTELQLDHPIMSHYNIASMQLYIWNPCMFMNKCYIVSFLLVHDQHLLTPTTTTQAAV